jgi:hypothetical protein
MISMFQCLNIFGRKQQASKSLVNELPLTVQLPAGFEGQTVPSSTVMLAFLWQHYGLDLLHPELDRWLEENAPDVRYAVAENKSASSDKRSKLRVGANGTMRVRLSLKVDQRLREVSSQYILWQVGDSMEPRTELRLTA